MSLLRSLSLLAMLQTLLFLNACLPVACGFQTESSPLADAMEAQSMSVVETLSDGGADVNETQPDGMTALHWAVYHDQSEWADRLLQAGADAEAANRYGITPLFLACRNGNGATVRRLLDAGANPNATFAGGETVLMIASRTGKLDPVATLIERSADVNTQDRKGQTALMWAAADGHLQVVDALLKAGAEFRKPLPSGFTPLLFAIRQGHTHVAIRLLQAGLDINEPAQPDKPSNNGLKSGITPLMLAVENGHFETAAALLDLGADANDDSAGYTALHAITWVRKPIRGDGDPPPQGSGTMTSLQMVRDLVEHGADVNAPHGRHSPQKLRLNKTDATPLLLAAETGDVPLMKLLIELGADPRKPNADECTPLLAACGVGVIGDGDETAGTEEEAIEAVKFLLGLGADINAVDRNGQTAMHGAAFKSWTQLIPFLVEQGADATVWNQENVLGWTPLEIARGHRPGNFRPSAETIEIIEKILKSKE